MLVDVFIIIESYFLLGAIIYWFIQIKTKAKSKIDWSKFFTYMFIVNLISYSMGQHPTIFKLIAFIIVIQGLYELFQAVAKKNHTIGFKFSVLLVYGFVSFGFLQFTTLPVSTQVWTYIAIFLFDGFSQIGGQIFGKTKLAKRISPNKTIEGSIIGFMITLGSIVFLDHISGYGMVKSIIIGLLICLFSLMGDLLASWVKRKCGIKDYGRILPGHGGFLDRFDSLLLSGAFVFL